MQSTPAGGATTTDIPSPRASLLVVTGDELFGRALASAFLPAGYLTTFATTLEEAAERVRSQAPDALVLHASFLQADPSATFVVLGQFPEIGRRTPLIVVSTTHLSTDERRSAVRAGAWHVVEAPINVEDLALQLDVYVGVKREMDGYRDAALLDPLTGLYTPPGIRHRALELAALSARAHEPLACVVFSPAASAVTRDAVGEAIARSLRDLGRRSDAIGSLGDGFFAVVATATPVQGATQLAERLAQGMVDNLRRQLRAGYDVATAVDKPIIAAPRLIEHARLAAEESVTGNGDLWLRGYQEPRGR